MQLIVVAGAVSTGKTTALFPNEQLGITGLPIDQMYYISCAGTGKELPLKGWKRIFKPEAKISEGGRFKRTNDPTTIRAIIDHVINNEPSIKHLVIDDVNYSQSFQVLNRTSKMEYEDWRKLATNFFSGIIAPVTQENAARDLTVILQFHIQRKVEGDDFKLKTAGSMIDSYIELEGLLSWLLFTYPKETIVDGKAVTQYYYLTNRMGAFPAKTLPGAFDDLFIPADMGVVVKAVQEYGD